MTKEPISLSLGPYAQKSWLGLKLDLVEVEFSFFRKDSFLCIVFSYLVLFFEYCIQIFKICCLLFEEIKIKGLLVP